MSVLLTTVGTWGDVNPFLRKAQGLKARGHAVALLTHCRYEQQARRAGLDFIALDTPEGLKRRIDQKEIIRLELTGWHDDLGGKLRNI